MRFSQTAITTLREAPADAEVASHALLVRANFIRKLAAGIYTYLPLGYRVLRKIEQIVREEMDSAGAQELLMPTVQPAELWQETGRWQEYGELLAKLKDRQKRDFCLGPTHEEVITDLARRDIRSYKQMPVTYYQIQTKFRDELRARGGLIRAREFVMKDAYSFDMDESGLDVSFERMYQAYRRAFDRMGLKYQVVEAEGGAIGGTDTREFMVPAEAGEDEMMVCDSCGYAANRERAECGKPRGSQTPSAAGKLRKVSTPGMKTVQQVTEFLGVDAPKLVKTLLCQTESGIVAALIRGDRDLNETKLARVLGQLVAMADAETVERVSGAEVGYAGPIGLTGVRLIADQEILHMTDAVCGANETDAHLVGVQPGLDFEPDEVADLRLASDGDPCPQCSGALRAARCIEIGHVFKLGTKYSAKMRAHFTNEGGEEKPTVMGCYGIGISRLMAVVAEVSHDDKGLIWPSSIAPYDVTILLLDFESAQLRSIAESLHDQLEARGVSVLFDDRDERPGVKFADADLIGLPLQVLVGKRTKQSNEVEVRRRADKTPQAVGVGQAVEFVAALSKG